VTALLIALSVSSIYQQFRDLPFLEKEDAMGKHLVAAA